MNKGRISDSYGNCLNMDFDGTHFNLSLRLKKDGILRRIGYVRDKVYYKLENKNGIFNTLNAFGFCGDAILHTAPDSVVVFYNGERYYISRERFDIVKQYLNWKNIGFEQRCYVPLCYFKRRRKWL